MPSLYNVLRGALGGNVQTFVTARQILVNSDVSVAAAVKNPLYVDAASRVYEADTVVQCPGMSEIGKDIHKTIFAV